MNCTIERIKGFNNITRVEQQTRSRHLNSRVLFVMSTKSDLPRTSSSQRLQWQRDHSPRSSPSARAINNNTSIVLRQRANRVTCAVSLLAIFCVLKRARSELDTDTATELKDRSQCLSSRDPCSSVEMVNKTREA